VHSYICRTDPADVARVESKTYVVTKDKHQTIPRSLEGAKGGMGQWMAPEVMAKEMEDRFRNCMAGMFCCCCSEVHCHASNCTFHWAYTIQTEHQLLVVLHVTRLLV